jgi:hypothetical protein
VCGQLHGNNGFLDHLVNVTETRVLVEESRLVDTSEEYPNLPRQTSLLENHEE